jgi:maltose O-acetyltransferase
MSRPLAYLVYYLLARHLPESTKPYSLGSKRIRRTLAERLLLECGKSANIEHGADFGSGIRVRLGDRSGIGVNCRLIGDVRIGNDVMMGPDVLIVSVNHEVGALRPMIDQGMAASREVVIDDNVWIGARAIILPGVHIAHGVIVGAGSVVSRNVPALSVVVGNPARVVRTRTHPAPVGPER